LRLLKLRLLKLRQRVIEYGSRESRRRVVRRLHLDIAAASRILTRGRESMNWLVAASAVALVAAGMGAFLARAYGGYLDRCREGWDITDSSERPSFERRFAHQD
jgi:hypothetical protein